MADERGECRWFTERRDRIFDLCTHPLHIHLDTFPAEIRDDACHGCPCHAPVVKDSLTTQPDPTPNGGKTGHDRP